MDGKNNRKSRIIVIVLAALCCVIFAVSTIFCIRALQPAETFLVEIVSGERVLYTLDLATAEDELFTVEYQGRTNTVQVKEGEICVIHADCPDQTCVHMGKLISASLPIVCLPNHLVIRYAAA